VKRILFVVNSDWGFLLYRTPLAKAAKGQGVDVWVATPNTGVSHEIIEMGFNYIELPISRDGKNIFSELLTFLRIIRIYIKLSPDIMMMGDTQKTVIGTYFGYNSAAIGANIPVSLAKKLKRPKVVEE
jgi:hypothetical protein